MKSNNLHLGLIDTLSKLYGESTLDADKYFSHLVNILSSYFASDRCLVSTDPETKSASVLIYPNKKSYLTEQEFLPVTFITNYLPKYPSGNDKILGIYNDINTLLTDNLASSSILAGANVGISSGMDVKSGLAELIYALRRLQNEDTYSLITAIFVPYKDSQSAFYPYLANPDNKIFAIGNEKNTLECGVFPTSLLTVETKPLNNENFAGSNFPSNQYADFFTQTLKVVIDYLEENYSDNYNIWQINTDTGKFTIKASVCDIKNDIIDLANLDRLLLLKLDDYFSSISGISPTVRQGITNDLYLQLDQKELHDLRSQVNSIYDNSLKYKFVRESFANRLVQYGTPFVVLPSGYSCNEKYKDFITYKDLSYYSEKIFQLAISLCQKESIFQNAYNSTMFTMLNLFLSPFIRTKDHGKTLQQNMERYSLELSKSSELEEK